MFSTCFEFLNMKVTYNSNVFWTEDKFSVQTFKWDIKNKLGLSMKVSVTFWFLWLHRTNPLESIFIRAGNIVAIASWVIGSWMKASLMIWSMTLENWFIWCKETTVKDSEHHFGYLFSLFWCTSWLEFAECCFILKRTIIHFLKSFTWHVF